MGDSDANRLSVLSPIWDNDHVSYGPLNSHTYTIHVTDEGGETVQELQVTRGHLRAIAEGGSGEDCSEAVFWRRRYDEAEDERLSAIAERDAALLRVAYCEGRLSRAGLRTLGEAIDLRAFDCVPWESMLGKALSLGFDPSDTITSRFQLVQFILEKVEAKPSEPSIQDWIDQEELSAADISQRQALASAIAERDAARDALRSVLDVAGAAFNERVDLDGAIVTISGLCLNGLGRISAADDENGDSVDIQQLINERNQAIAERDAARKEAAEWMAAWARLADADRVPAVDGGSASLPPSTASLSAAVAPPKMGER